MAAAPVDLLTWQINEVRRRMFLQHMVNSLVVAWVAAAALFAVWWLARPYAIGAAAQPWMDWTVGSVAFLGATLIAILIAARRTPDPVVAALSLDERFQLRERVTTTLTMSPQQQATPAGQALLSDVQARINDLDVGSRFPVRFGWKSALVPASVVALVLLTLFYDPVITSAQGGDTATATPLPPEVVKELEQKKQEFLQKPQTEKKDEQRQKSPDLQKIEAKLQEILKRPMNTTDEVKDRLAEISKLEEEVKQKEKEEAQKLESLKEQLSKLDKLEKKNKPKPEDDKGEDKDGEKKPGEELRDALKDGDTEKAKKEAERLSKKLKNNEMKPEEKDHLKEETKQLKDDLERLKREREKELKEKQEENEKRRQEKEKQLEQQRAENKLDKEEFDRKKKELEEERQKEQQAAEQEKKDLEELQQKLEKCEQCLKDGDQEGAAQAMKEAGQKLDEMQQREQDLEDLQGELQRMQDLRESMAKACENPGSGRDGSGSEDDAERLTRRDEKQGGQGNQGGRKSGVGKGRRPDGKPIATNSKDAKEKTPLDQKGAKINVGTAGQAEKVIGKTGVSLQGEIKQASQEAPEAVETQRIPRGYKDATKGYFQRIGNQKTGDNVPKK